LKKAINIFFLLLQHFLFGQYNPNAGLITPFSENATITISSGVNTSFITDRNKNSFWESDNPLPSNNIKRNDLNFFKTNTTFTASQNISYAIDGNLNTQTTIQPQPFIIRFNKPEFFYFLSIKHKTDRDISMTVRLNTDSVKIFILKPGNNYQLQKFALSRLIKSITFNSPSPFNLFEIAGLQQPPTEFVFIDMHKPKPVGQIYIRALNNNRVSNIEVKGGNNKNSLNNLFS